MSLGFSDKWGITLGDLLDMRTSRVYKLRPDDDLVFLLDWLDLAAYPEELELLIKMWENDVPFEQIVEAIRPDNVLARNYDDRACEVFAMLMHLSLKGKITARAGFIFGERRRGK